MDVLQGVVVNDQNKFFMHYIVSLVIQGMYNGVKIQIVPWVMLLGNQQIFSDIARNQPFWPKILPIPTPDVS